MVDAAHLIDTLRPLREPPAPASLAPVFVMLALGCAAALAVLFVAWRIRRRHGVLRKAATAALSATRGLAPAERLAAQARVLRRLVRSAVGDTAAAEQGDAWLRRLDTLFDTSFFTNGAGSAYGQNLYRRPDSIDVDTLDRELVRFFARMRLTGAHGR